MKRDALDDKDKKILEVLKDDGRASVRAISKETGIRPSTVHQRIQRLVADEVIEKFTVKLNDEKIGEPLTVFMLVSGTMERYLDVDDLLGNTVKEIHGVTGDYDMLMKCKFKDIREFNRFLVSFRERYAGHVVKTVTMVQTAKVKSI